jgi:DnaJ domain
MQIFTMRLLLCIFAWILLLSSSVLAGEEEDRTKKFSSTSKFDATDHTDWGTYYDPKGAFCGNYDCYKILGFDYEEFGKQHPDRKEITQRFRTLSRAWHPDKSKHKDAKDRFVVSYK